MRSIIQRVSRASVTVDGTIAGSIGLGLLILLGIAKGDTDEDADYLLRKILDLRIFPDAAGKMNRDLREAGGELLIISNFTVYGDTRKGRRPSFDAAAPVPDAARLYEYFVEQARLTGARVQSGVFQAHMEVELVNHGPVTLICESKRSGPPDIECPAYNEVIP